MGKVSLSAKSQGIRPVTPVVPIKIPSMHLTMGDHFKSGTALSY